MNCSESDSVVSLSSIMSERRTTTTKTTRRRLISTVYILLLAIGSICALQSVSAANPKHQASIGEQQQQQQDSRFNPSCMNKKQQQQQRLYENSWNNQFNKRDLESSALSRRAVNATTGSNTTSPTAVNSTGMLCNGRSDICDLRYNQVTYPGTHNSGTYSLQYDCDTSVQTCLSTKTVCQAQAQNCTMGWEVQCTKMSNSCLDRLPNWLHWLCGAFTSACEGTEQVCLGWEQICTDSLDVCTLWGSACFDVIPDWAIECLWENQPGHTVTQQLNDGIRFLDMGTCLTNNNTQVVMCHGYGAQRAIGDTLDSVMTQIVNFMDANPYEVVTVEFNEYDGDTTLMSNALVAKIEQYFTLPSGQSMMWPRTSASEPWPTLRTMILANQRIMLFMSNTYYSIPAPVPAWANQKDQWKLDGFSYSYNDSEPAQLNQSYYNWCQQGPPTDGSYVLWQQIDINLAIIEQDIINTLKQAQVPSICIGPLAVDTNSAMLDALAAFCYTRWPYWFRVRVNDYWQGDVFKVASNFNDLNVARVKAGDSITPY